MTPAILLTGRGLGVDELRAVARDGAPVTIDPAARERIARANVVVRAAAAAGEPVYGVTTGLGSRATIAVADPAGTRYSERVIRGRATAVGEPLPRDVVRAAMLVRLAGLCAGGAGASPAVADALVGMLGAGVHPVVPRSGSVGAADLCLMAHIGLGLIGEGEAELAGERMPAGEALARAGLAPPALGPKDGLALCSSSGVAVGGAALALAEAEDALDALQVAAALSLEGFRANLSPLDPRVTAARPAPGQAWAADGLRVLLRGGGLGEPGAARRVQDPLSLRCVAPVHGALRTALDGLAAALAPELSGAPDNPLVLLGDAEADAAILSTGNFQAPALALALDGAAIAAAQVGHLAAERQARLKATRLSGLPAGLAPPEPDGAPSTRAGLAPLSKTAHALVLELRALAAPLSIHGLVGADGVEDDSTGAAQGALRLRASVERLRLLGAVELVVAAQALDLVENRDGAPVRLGPATAEARRAVREQVATLVEDRAIGPEVERVAATLLARGELVGRVRAVAGGRA